MRQNLLRLMQEGGRFCQGIVGYDDTVLPQIEHAVLSRHDFLLLGQRGQAKTRLIRQLVNLLDEWMPALEGTALHDDPFRPITKRGRHLIADKGDDAPIEWIHRADRYQEKLATPDVTIADLIGDIDPIKAMAERLHFADEEVINYGIIPRSNRGIFAINELPDLQQRIQVGLLNIMEEKDIQIRGFPVRIPLDLCIVYTANPEDYTNRGNIITPLKDRIDAQIITHYPDNVEDAKRITAQEAWTKRDAGIAVHVPPLIAEIVERVAEVARKSEYTDRNSGVSARMSISFLETLISSAERRALLNRETTASARLADLFESLTAISGKVELVYKGEQEGVANVALHLLGEGIKDAFNRRFIPNFKPGREQKFDFGQFKELVDWFEAGNKLALGSSKSEAEHIKTLLAVPRLRELAQKHMKKELARVPEGELRERAEVAAMEFLVEGLHQNFLLSKVKLGRVSTYSDSVSQMMEEL